MKNKLVGIWRINHDMWHIRATRLIWNFKENGGLFEQSDSDQSWGSWSIKESDEETEIYINSPTFGNLQGVIIEKFEKLWIKLPNERTLMLSK